jgi:SAM-dependent methyltransferase
MLATELGLDRTGRLLDIGCGPGILTVELAPLFEEAIGLDPDLEMRAEGERRARERGLANIRWVQGLAEEIGTAVTGRFRLVTFGRSFHWTDRERVAEMVYDILDPGGALALIGDAHEGRPRPEGPGYPPVPREAIREVIDRYLGERSRRHDHRHEEALTRTRFGPPRILYCAGRADIVRNVDDVLANCLSKSSSAPHLFGDRLPQFEAEIRELLAVQSPSGLFWEWPGDTAVMLSLKAK